MINFNQNEISPTIIKVIGVGGGGCNAVEYMFRQGICDVDFVLCNTDAQVLKDSSVPFQIHLGQKQTEGYGSGTRPKVGEASAQESLEEIRSLLQQPTKMVFITAAMGKGTGTGASPVIAQMAKEMGILTVGVVSIPSRFEGPERLEQARGGVNRLKNFVDSLIVIDNENIQRMYGSQTLSTAFGKANDVLNTAVKGIAEIITLPGYINVDFADVRTVMTDSGMAIMGAARASGENRARRVIVEALNSPLLNRSSISGASNVLLNITSGMDEITMDEMTEITSYVIHEVGDSADVIWGVGTDESLGDAVSVTVIATGFPLSEVDEMFVTHLRGHQGGVTPAPGGGEGKGTEEHQGGNTPDQGGRRERIQDGVKRYVRAQLEESEVVLQPHLPPEKLKEIWSTPAYLRRPIKIDKV